MAEEGGDISSQNSERRNLRVLEDDRVGPSREPSTSAMDEERGGGGGG